MKSNYNSELEVNLYFIKSDFKDILIRLCKKALEEKDRYLINLKDEAACNFKTLLDRQASR